MAERRVVVQTVTPEQAKAAREAMPEADRAGALLFGTLPEERIPELEQAGCAVEVVDAPPPTTTTLRTASAGPPMPATRGFGAVPAPDVRLDEPPVGLDDVWVIRLRGPLLPQWREALRGARVELIEHQGDLGFTARLALSDVHAINELPFVEGLRPYGLNDTIHPGQVSATRAATPEAAARPKTFELLVHREQDAESVLGWMAQRQAQVVLAAGRKVRFTGAQPRALAREAGRLPAVAVVYEFVRPTPSNDHARVVIGLDERTSPVPLLPQTGRGQIVGVADTGLDADHPDFAGRIAGLVARGRPGDATDITGHGTHVAGSVLGDGAASGGTIRGVAPEARLFFQSVMDAKREFSGLDPSLADLLQEAYDAGVRVHNDSWGVRGAASSYRADSLEVDEFVAAHPDMLVVIAAGNSGTARAPLNGPPGFVDLLSVETPATAKNALTVGASRSDRVSPAADATWGAWWPQDFPQPPIAAEPVSGDADTMAAFSSRGPCDEQIRMKPDLVAPGTMILSARAAGATGQPWAPYPPNPHYAYDGGTSMAAPIVAGCAAIVRQYLVDERDHRPSAALLKALLVNGTRWLTGADAVANHPAQPNYHQGFGCVSLTTTIPNPKVPALQLELSDRWEDDAEAIADTGDQRRYLVALDGALPLRLCLAWTDAPRRALQNALQLRVDHPATGSVWHGNQHRPALVATPFDRGNNVHVVRIAQPPPGDYVISVTGGSILVPGQRFALAVTSSLTAPLTAL